MCPSTKCNRQLQCVLWIVSKHIQTLSWKVLCWYIAKPHSVKLYRLDSRNSSNKHGGQRAFHRTPQFALLADWTSEDRISKESWLFQLPMWNLIFNDNHQSNVEFDNSQTKLLSFSGWPKRLTHDRHKHECEKSKLELRSTTGYLSGTSRGLHHLA